MRPVLRIAEIALVAFVVGCGGPLAEPVRAHGHTAAELVGLIRGQDVKARRRAVVSLGNMGTADAVVVPALTEALKDSDAEVRASAATSLYKLGPAAKEAEPALEAATRDRDPKVRDHAAKALARVRS
jgi:HEAT repeat protein